ncbi:phage tail protein [Pectobacterium carotovorum]|uniref:phage tail protein n=1 Tax=Pectobacterium carotovorum TaxID=554 RepID=UPI001CF11D74|nr:phage tail protein [Pectobacterium carotovorum]MCA6969315.1 tail fiber protein [Pectobacterium carotovorum]
MANLSEQESWIDGIYQLETSDPVVAGPGGISNRQAEQLASRTAYLKKMQETTGESLQVHLAASDPHSQYAPKNSPALTGTPTAPTTAQTANNTQIATTAFVKSALAALVNGSPAALDTLQELASALGNDPHFSTTVVNAIADVKTDVANKLNAHVSILDAHPQYAPKASPAFTGTPTAPTAASGSNDTQLATTAFVKAAVAALVNGSPAALDTLQELANALGNDPNFSTTVLNALAGKLAKDQNGADIPDKAKFRGNMGLVKQTSVSDYTSGSVLINGAWGLGGSGIMADDANEIIQSGQSKFFRSSANKDVNINWPNSDGYAWRGINVAWDTNASSMLAFNQSNGTAPDQPRMHYRTRAGGMNSPWLNVLMSNQYTVDTNGYLKTPTSATMTSTSIGAMSINDLAGIPLPFPGAVAPAGWLKCNGQQFDKAQYPILASRYPSGFLPDLRGEFVRGWDDGRGADAGRALLSVQGDAIRSHKHSITMSHEPAGTKDSSGFPATDGSEPFIVHSETNPDGSVSDTTGKGNPLHSFGGNETRPRNIAFNYIVRAA